MVSEPYIIKIFIKMNIFYWNKIVTIKNIFEFEKVMKLTPNFSLIH